MITLFCLRRAGERGPAGFEGPGGRPLRLVEEGSIGAWVCEGGVETDLDSVRAHDAVVRQALRSATPLPARFGTLFPDEEALRRSLEQRAAELQTALERVAGRVEMGIRVEWDVEMPTDVVSAVRSGREYLEARRRQLQRREALQDRAASLLDEVESRIAPDASERVRKLLPERGVAGTMAHLVHRQSVGLYRERVRDARHAFPQVNLHLTGPWAPYSFA